MQLDSSLQSRVYFIPLAQYLSEEYKLIALDTRKHGRSGIGVAPDPIDNCKMILPKNDPTRQVYQTITLKKWREMFGKKSRPTMPKISNNILENYLTRHHICTKISNARCS